MKKLQRLFDKYLISEDSSKIVAISLITLTLFNKVFGFISTLLVAYHLGASRPYDIFIAASTIPEFLTNILFIGVTNAAIIPVVIICLKMEDKAKFWRHMNNLIGMTALFYAVLSLILIIAAGPLTHLYIANYSNQVLSHPFTEAEIAQITRITQVLFIPQLLLGISIFVSSILQSFQKFIIVHLAPIVYNIGNIIGLLIYFNFVHGTDPKALAVGMGIGALFHLGIQLPLLIKLGFKFDFVLDFKDKYLVLLYTRGLKRAVGIVIDQVYVLLSRLFAINLVAGSLSAYTFALSLAVIPYTIFGVTLSSIAFPKLSHKFLDKDEEGFRHVLSSTLDKILFLSLPLTVLLAVLRFPVVRLVFGLFQSTNFTWEDTRLTAWVLFFLVIGIVPEAVKTLFIRVMYSRELIKNTVIIGIIGVFLDIASLILFINFFSNMKDLSISDLGLGIRYFFERSNGIAAVGGVAFASSLTATLVVFIYLYYIHTRVTSFLQREFWLPFSKKLFSTLMMTITTYWSFKLWGDILNTEKTIQILILTSLSAGIGVVTYFWFEYLQKDKILFRILPKWWH